MMVCVQMHCILMDEYEQSTLQPEYLASHNLGAPERVAFYH